MTKLLAWFGFLILLLLILMIGFVYSPSIPFKPNFMAITSPALRQAAFVSFMVPKIQYANQQIMYSRERLLSILVEWQTTGYLSRGDRRWLNDIAYVYGIKKFDVNDRNDVHELLLRVDVVPVSLVLAQAANESAWGTSRFAVHGDNFFGQHCNVPGCGMVAGTDPSAHPVEVQVFKNVQDAITNYLYNIDTNPAYSKFRDVRYQMRLSDKRLSGFQLAPALSSYSTLGQDYVHRIQDMISVIKQYDPVHVQPAT